MTMSSEGAILEYEARKIEWTIKDIISRIEEDVEVNYDSPCFTVVGSMWYLNIRMTHSVESDDESVFDDDDSDGWISIYLFPAKSQKYPISVSYTLGVKKADGTVKEIIVIDSYEFNDDSGFGCPEFLKRSELLEEKSELAPLDDLTVICLLQAKDNLDFTSSFIKLSEDLEDLFASKKFCDVTLNVQNEEFPAHKAVLATRSSVFAAMFETDMKEKNTGIVDIQDCVSGPFKVFLTYLYTGKSQISLDNVFNLYRIAHKYDVKELLSDCVFFIENNLSVENLYDAVILADQFDEEGVKIETRALFNQNFKDIVYTADWELFLKQNWRLTNELLKCLAASMKS